jgi:hypothetical protein
LLLPLLLPLLLLLLLLLQARSLKDALVAMDRTLNNIKEFAAWYKKYQFITPGERVHESTAVTRQGDEPPLCVHHHHLPRCCLQS